MYLHTGHGNIDVNLWIVGRKDLPGPIMRTTMHVSSGYGSLAVKVVRCTTFSSSPSGFAPENEY